MTTTTPATTPKEWPRRHIFVRTRTGKKIHIGSNGGSGPYCGVRTRIHNTAMQVPVGRVNLANVCESCAGIYPVSIVLEHATKSDDELLAEQAAFHAECAASVAGRVAERRANDLRVYGVSGMQGEPPSANFNG